MIWGPLLVAVSSFCAGTFVSAGDYWMALGMGIVSVMGVTGIIQERMR